LNISGHQSGYVNALSRSSKARCWITCMRWNTMTLQSSVTRNFNGILCHGQ
jgi:hypothetical protein